MILMSVFLDKLDSNTSDGVRRQIDLLLGMDNYLLATVEKEKLRLTGLTDGAQKLLQINVPQPVSAVLCGATIQILEQCAKTGAAASLQETIDDMSYQLEVRLAGEQLVLYFIPTDSNENIKRIYTLVNRRIDSALCNILAYSNLIMHSQPEKAGIKSIRANVLRAYRQMTHLQRLTENPAYAIAAYKSMDAAAFCQRLAQKASQYAPAGITIKSEAPEHLSVVFCESLMSEALTNLLVNAIMAKQVTTVTLAVSQKAGKLVFTVADDGAGLPMDMLMTLYEGWEQVTPAENELEMIAAGCSWGLGLPVVRENVRRHEGMLLMEPVQPQGTKFSIHLPADLMPLMKLEQSMDILENGLDPLEIAFAPLL